MASKGHRPLKKPKAAIDKLANENAANPEPSTAGQEAIDRVKKCFDRARHHNANEQEAGAATRLATRIMEKYQISQADIMVNEANTQRGQRGGVSTVNVRPHRGGGRAFTPGWVDWLVSAMTNFFDCRCFSTRRRRDGDDRIEWTFYGIAEHTVSAAIAFEAIHNQIQDWAEPYVGIQTRNSYCLGVADGLLELSKDERKASEAKAREAEKKALAAMIRDEEAREQERQALRFRVSITSESEDEMDVDSTAGMSANDTVGSSDVEKGAHAKADNEIDTTMDDVSDNDVSDDEASDDDGSVYSVSDDELSDDDGSDYHSPDFTEHANKSTTVGAGADCKSQLHRFSIPSQRKEEEEEADEKTVQWRSRRQLTTYRQMSKQIAEDVAQGA
ncbi:MAG: hypothetical protein Q9210_003675 [Variospora velana]